MSLFFRLDVAKRAKRAGRLVLTQILELRFIERAAPLAAKCAPFAKQAAAAASRRLPSDEKNDVFALHAGLQQRNADEQRRAAKSGDVVDGDRVVGACELVGAQLEPLLRELERRRFSIFKLPVVDLNAAHRERRLVVRWLANANQIRGAKALELLQTLAIVAAADCERASATIALLCTRRCFDWSADR